jgi:CBS domain-containing protein
MQQVSVRHILEVKGNDIWSIEPGASVFDALNMMSNKDVGALIVMNGKGMVGILSERDYARKIILLGKTSRETRVDEIMSEDVVTIHPDQTIEEAMEMMNSKHIRHLPVEEDGKVIGMVTIRDLMKVIIYKQLQSIRTLEDRLISMWQH